MINRYFYKKIIQSMPIPCVDIIVGDKLDNVLLLKRTNEPVKGYWWFPGGRVLFNEKREDAVARIAKQECNINALPQVEMGTYDLILPSSQKPSVSHAITTLYYLQVDNLNTIEIMVDMQSEGFKIKHREEWLKLALHEFVRNGLNELKKIKQSH